MTETRTRPEPVGEPAPTPIEDLPVPSPPLPREPERTPDDEQRDDYPLTVWEAIAEVTRQTKAITKDKQTTGGERFYFRGIDDALEALHPIFGEVGLVLLPGEVVRESWETRATAKGGTLNVARLLVRYMMVGPDGSSMTGEAWGEAGDSGDKATQKAHSQSYKTFVFQTFSIPTRDSARDEPDAVSEASRPFTADEMERAERALGAAQATTTVEELAGVRHRALTLLDVPVRLADGTTSPLGYLIDLQRRKIEAGS